MATAGRRLFRSLLGDRSMLHRMPQNGHPQLERDYCSSMSNDIVPDTGADGTGAKGQQAIALVDDDRNILITLSIPTHGITSCINGFFHH